MSDDVSRRELLSGLAASIFAGPFAAEAAQHAHNMVVEEKKTTGVYKPKLFNPHEYATVRRLAELIIPADEKSKGAVEAGAPEFIDLLCSNNAELASIYRGGVAWLDRQMERRHRAPFVKAAPAAQTAMLDLIAYRKNDGPELGPGIVFFDWVRKMVVDAYYTSPVGVRELGYMGNKGMTTFQVPAEAIAYALKKSGLG